MHELSVQSLRCHARCLLQTGTLDVSTKFLLFQAIQDRDWAAAESMFARASSQQKVCTLAFGANHSAPLLTYSMKPSRL